MNLGAVFFVGNLTCSFHMLHTWPIQFYRPSHLTFILTLHFNYSLLRVFVCKFESMPFYWLQMNLQMF